MKLELRVKDRILVINLYKDEFKSPLFLHNRDDNSNEFNKNDIEISIEISDMDFNDYIKIVGFIKYVEDTYKTKFVQYEGIEDDGKLMISGFIYINASRFLRLDKDAYIDIHHHDSNG